jgi:hypothetical protein
MKYKLPHRIYPEPVLPALAYQRLNSKDIRVSLRPHMLPPMAKHALPAFLDTFQKRERGG